MLDGRVDPPGANGLSIGSLFQRIGCSMKRALWLVMALSLAWSHRGTLLWSAAGALAPNMRAPITMTEQVSVLTIDTAVTPPELPNALVAAH